MCQPPRYGDIGPANNESRMFIMVVILVSFTSVGNLLGRISAAVARSSPWRTWYVPQKNQPHIILAGAPQGYYLKFFAELFSEVTNKPTSCSKWSAFFCYRLLSLFFFFSLSLLLFRALSAFATSLHPRRLQIPTPQRFPRTKHLFQTKSYSPPTTFFLVSRCCRLSLGAMHVCMCGFFF
jgi:hypothetical protein